MNIISLIAIVLLGLATVAGAYMGGSKILESKPEAEAARYINEGQQISGAIRLYQTENAGALPSNLSSDLVGPYLKTLPKAAENWDIASDAIIKGVATADTCQSVNKRAGWTNPNWVEGSTSVSRYEPISCDDPSLSSQVYYCCVASSAPQE